MNTVLQGRGPGLREQLGGWRGQGWGSEACGHSHVRVNQGRGSSQGLRQTGGTWDSLGRRKGVAVGVGVSLGVGLSGCQGGRGCQGVCGCPWVSGCLWVSGVRLAVGVRRRRIYREGAARGGSWWQPVGDSAQVPGPGTASSRGLCLLWSGRSGEVGCLLLEELSLQRHEMRGGDEGTQRAPCPSSPSAPVGPAHSGGWVVFRRGRSTPSGPLVGLPASWETPAWPPQSSPKGEKPAGP